MFRSLSFHFLNVHMRVCPHRNLFGPVVKHSDELVSLQEDAFFGSVQREEGPCQTLEEFTATEKGSDAKFCGTNGNLGIEMC